MIIEWKCPKYWNIDLDKLKADGKDTVIIDGGQIVGKIISMEARNGELYAKVEISDKFEKELNDRLYSRCIVSSSWTYDASELPKFNYDNYNLGECNER